MSDRDSHKKTGESPQNASTAKPGHPKSRDARAERLAAALRANLGRRKAAVRAQSQDVTADEPGEDEA
ncbi:hypothetical protein OSH11_14015 [Kaistia dalseonensis]|uniref:Uncharacterized protein n=1 Tax=Kaistia dalseonensis TaxID=410840 RepID=A0ABU0H7Z3_9HYPH|nr:hypothetical protein [Kaistia dalseonensis]MCX5495825.1 hypothetical protein [Kaistia dalseonensis]MDQ0438426.1 hypothetical protein [Kaistia dalseonensis]